MRGGTHRAQLAVRMMRARPGLLDVDCRNRALLTLRERRGGDEEQLQHRHHGGNDARGAGEGV